MSEAVTLKEWLDNHHITYSLRKDVLVIPGFGRCLIQENYDHIFKQNKDGEAVFNSIENMSYLLADDITYIVFPFGCRWFYVDIRKDPLDLQFQILRYVGDSPVFEHKCEFYPLGIHSGYELLNGSGLLKDWCTKTKFLGYKGLSVADRNTMAASLDLQQSATEKGIKYCFGYSLTVNTGKDKVGVKIYSATQQGFKNMLRIQKAIMVDSADQTLTFRQLLDYAEGLVLVLGKRSGLWLNQSKHVVAMLKEAFGKLYFQVDLTEYKAERIDVEVLHSVACYFENFADPVTFSFEIEPILICDCYYLDKEDARNKIILNKIATSAAHEQSDEQYFKDVDEHFTVIEPLFSNKWDVEKLFERMCGATVEIAEAAEAAYETDRNFMPRYDMTDEEKQKYGDRHAMFLALLEEGFERLVPKGEEEVYRKRLEHEIYILESTDNVDYCLVQFDTVNWARTNGILVGCGRGSAGGCLALYLMGITLIDPIKYNLLFERFLLPERAGLYPAQATVLAGEIESTSHVELTLGNGKVLRLDKDAQLLVVRDETEIVVYADQLNDGDDLVFDHRDYLWNVNYFDNERQYNAISR